MPTAPPDQDESSNSSPWTIRAATWVGRSMGRWRRRRAVQRDDRYVQQWRRAWLAGRAARWGGAAQDAVPRRSVARDAWLAGWLWADTQPDRRNPLRTDRRSQVRATMPRRARDVTSSGQGARFGSWLSLVRGVATSRKIAQ